MERQCIRSLAIVEMLFHKPDMPDLCLNIFRHTSAHMLTLVSLLSFVIIWFVIENTQVEFAVDLLIVELRIRP